MKQLILLTLMISINTFSQNNNCNCCTEKHSEFDFWVGSWNVTTPNGKSAGTNTITKDQDNCLLRENWISATKGYTGVSTNFYNAQAKQWEQLWVDNQGGSLHLKGKRIGNQMILESDMLTNTEGRPFIHRITWTANDDGTVRQYWETITNGDKINIAFDGLYKRTD
jgi:hypothetical protein